MVEAYIEAESLGGRYKQRVTASPWCKSFYFISLLGLWFVLAQEDCAHTIFGDENHVW
jgi:hypothetical protein